MRVLREGHGSFKCLFKILAKEFELSFRHPCVTRILLRNTHLLSYQLLSEVISRLVELLTHLSKTHLEEISLALHLVRVNLAN